MEDRLATHESWLVTSIVPTEEQVWGQKFLRDFAAACRKMSRLAEILRGGGHDGHHAVRLRKTPRQFWGGCAISPLIP